jgi:2-(1,2-epoxy-1,2-dihydrophenyl)acetyl-CoA isomerase
MAYTTIRLEDVEGVRVIRLARPERKNALDLVMREELREALEVSSSHQEVRALVLTGEGSDFSVGGDLNTMENLTAASGRKRVQRVGGLVGLLRQMAQPVLAAVDGVATGAGLGLALACDLIVASDRARFGVGQVRVGLAPDLGLTRHLPLRVGWTRAMEMMLQGHLIEASKALEWGLINRVVPHPKLLEEALSWASQLARGPSVALSMVKECMDRFPMSLEQTLRWEANLQAIAFLTEDFAEAREAFFQKRKPRFRGR